MSYINKQNKQMKKEKDNFKTKQANRMKHTQLDKKNMPPLMDWHKEEENGR